jgi:hypothetical protein
MLQGANLIVQSGLISFLGHAFQRSVPFLIPMLFVSQQVFQVDAAVRSRQVIGQIPRFQQLDEERSRDAEQFSGLLRGQVLHHGNNGDGLPFFHDAEDLQQQIINGIGQLHSRFAPFANEQGFAFLLQQFMKRVNLLFLRSRQCDGIESRRSHHGPPDKPA